MHCFYCRLLSALWLKHSIIEAAERLDNALHAVITTPLLSKHAQTLRPCAQEVKARGSGKVLLSGQLEHGVVPHESVWDCGGGIGEVRC